MTRGSCGAKCRDPDSSEEEVDEGGGEYRVAFYNLVILSRCDIEFHVWTPEALITLHLNTIVA